MNITREHALKLADEVVIVYYDGWYQAVWEYFVIEGKPYITREESIFLNWRLEYTKWHSIEQMIAEDPTIRFILIRETREH